MISPVRHAPKPLRLSPHAACRILEHEISLDTVREVLARPFLTGEARDGARFACAAGTAHGRRTWVTVVFHPHTGGVATVYPGQPTEKCRGPLGGGGHA